MESTSVLLNKLYAVTDWLEYHKYDLPGGWTVGRDSDRMYLSWFVDTPEGVYDKLVKKFGEPDYAAPFWCRWDGQPKLYFHSMTQIKGQNV